MTALRNPWVWGLNLLLALQAAGFYVLSRPEQSCPAGRLRRIPLELGEWRIVRQMDMDADTRDQLQPDDYLIRDYRQASSGVTANLFIAWYRSQRGGRVPHSPRNCLPAHGWTSTRGGAIPIVIPGKTKPISVNRYLVTKGEERAVVIYWYQTAARDIAGEYEAGIYQILDTVRLNRSDTALVRVVAPVEFADETSVERAAIRFVETVYPSTRSIW